MNLFKNIHKIYCTKQDPEFAFHPHIRIYKYLHNVARTITLASKISK